jgi:hypothetical protein
MITRLIELTYVRHYKTISINNRLFTIEIFQNHERKLYYEVSEIINNIAWEFADSFYNPREAIDAIKQAVSEKEVQND